VDSEHGLLHEAEAAQRTEQLVVAESLAARREADAPGRLLQQRRGGEGLQHAGLLGVAIAVNDAVRTRQRALRVNRVDHLLIRGFSRGGMLFITPEAVFARAA